MSIEGRPWGPSYPARLPRVATTLAISAVAMIGIWPLLQKDIISSLPVATMLSSLSTITLALAVRHLLRLLGVADTDRAAALVFVVPGVTLMGLSDTLWVAPIIMALAAAIRRRHVAMLGWCGLALGLKAQALLIAPFFLALLINRRVPIRLWPIAPLMAAAILLPAWAAGWPALVTTHLARADAYDALSLDAPNIWAIVDILPLGNLPLLGLAFACAIGASAGYIARFSAQPLSDRLIVPTALLVTLLTAGLLPGMHERSFLLADILALILALVIRDRTSVRIALLIQLGSVLAILGHATDIDALTIIGAFSMIAATVQLARPLLKPAANDNPLIARTA